MSETPVRPNIGDSGFRVKIKKYSFFNFSRNDSQLGSSLSFLRKQESAASTSVAMDITTLFCHSCESRNPLLKIAET
jgi:hypothetical protein